MRISSKRLKPCVAGKLGGLHVMNKSSKKIVIRVDGHKGIGMGHIYRMLTLSRYLRQRYRFDILFILRNSKPAIDLIKKHQFRTYALKFDITPQDELSKLIQILSAEGPHVVAVDLLKRCHEQSFMENIKSASNACVIAFTDVHEKSEVQSDIVINSSILQKKEYYEHIHKTRYYLGSDYGILPPEYITVKERTKTKEKIERVMICMGGVDHNNLTFPILRTIDKSAHNFVCDVILSTAFFKKKTVNDVVKNLKHDTTVHYDLDGILDLLIQADMAITAGGIVHAERICAGVPGIAISQEMHQAASVREFASFGAAMDLGLSNELKSKTLLRAFDDLLENKEMRERMSKLGRRLIDGKGLLRVSDLIVRECQE